MSRVEEYETLMSDLINFFERLKTEYNIDFIDTSRQGADLDRMFREREQRFDFILTATLWYGMNRYPHRYQLVWIDDALEEIIGTYPLQFADRAQIDTEMASDPDPNIKAFMMRVLEWMVQQGYLRTMGGGGSRTNRKRKTNRRTNKKRLHK